MIWEIDEGRKVVEGLDEDGRPDPAYAAALGLKPAPLGRRALATTIELAIFSMLQLPYWLVALPSLVKVATGALQPYGLASHPDLVWMIIATAASAVLTIAFVVVQLVLHGRRGVTLGKALTGIRSVNVATLARPGIGRAVLRGLVLWAVFLVPVVGPVLFFASPLLDREKRGRGWLDKVGGTWFVDVNDGLDPYHDKKMRIARKTVSAAPEAAKSQLPSLATPADSLAQAYRPGARISSGVVGAARPQQLGTEQVGLASQPAADLPSHTVPGMPAGGARLGGYRPGELSGAAAPQPATPQASAPAPASAPSAPIGGPIIDSAPGFARPAPAAMPAAAAPTSSATPSAATSSAATRSGAPVASTIRDETVIEPDIDDVDDRTVRRVEIADDEDLEATRARSAGRPAVATLAFDTGDRFALTGAALVGRNPSPSAGEVVEHLLPFADDTRTVSKTHVLVTVAPLAVVDRASTNGSAVVRGGVEQQLEPGTPFALVPGDVVRFGDRTFTIEGAA
ncbi:RDD family protein [Agrococcus jenensis]|uniref:RDD family protein n=1 Tax=Agrococcus jenensis TaxID=46353 RepID=A0A3N2ASF6_9MICO|nr:RDD family protein [Agrococcus jenensis]ROR65983.1 RDD family protein [Agrococcus jenensis]